MAEKRKYTSHLDISSNIASVQIDRNEIMRLTKVAKSWDFTCSFCFKAFPSAQAMGGHQNAHRTERLEEKRLFVRDPIGYRKRAYLQAVKALKAGSSSSTNLNVVAHEPPKAINGEIMNGFPLVLTNFLPIEDFAGSVVEDAKGKKNVEFNDGGSGMASEDLDLTLKL